MGQNPGGEKSCLVFLLMFRQLVLLVFVKLVSFCQTKKDEKPYHPKTISLRRPLFKSRLLWVPHGDFEQQ